MKNEVVVDGETFRKINGTWVDEHYLVPAHEILTKVVRASFDGETLTDSTDEDLETCLQDFKTLSLFPEAMRITNLLWERYSARNLIGNLRRLLPVSTSLLRSLGKPQEAIDFYSNAIRHFGRGLESSASLTSLAATYCDIGDFAFAKKLCDRAYAMQGGAQESWNELTLVYKRIEAHLSS